MTNDNHQCRFCASPNVSQIIDFGSVGLAGAFLKPDQFAAEKKYDQQLYFCSDCYLLQIINKVPPTVLFKDYFYFSSAIATLRKHFRSYAKEVTEKFLIPKKSSVLEIGCNDGILLKPFVELEVKTVIGVDPSSNVIETIKDPNIIAINDFFTRERALKIREDYGPINMICANNVFAHIEDMHDVTAGIKTLLADDGVFVFEVHYIGSLIDEIQYDMIYHEHLFYYSLLALQNFFKGFDLEVFDVKPVDIHAGSMRYYVRHKDESNDKSVSLNVINLQKREREKGFDKLETFQSYADKVAQTKTDLMALLADLKQEQKSIVGYGASGRANTTIQYCGIDDRHIDYMIDDAPAKHGYYTPGSHLEIKPRSALEENTPDYILIFAWSFFNEIIEKNMAYLKQGVKFIVPLPEVKVFSWQDGQIVEKNYSETDDADAKIVSMSEHK